MKSILELSNVEAKEFFLKQESYCRIDLPVYFSFQTLLNAVSAVIDNKLLSDFYGNYFDEAKNKRNDAKLMGNIIDGCVRNMSFGQTNGIPQGSVLMDFIAEMILGFADVQLVERIKKSNIIDYKILRYRDDYRIFTNNPQDTDIIVKSLTEVLIDLGMKLNSSKTIASNNVVRDSLKPDKLYWLSQKQSSKGLQEQLFIVHSLSEKHPNAGVLVKSLIKFFDRIIKIEEAKEHLSVLISIVVDIMFKNPRAYPISAAILSKLFSLQENDDVRKKTIKKIIKRFNKIPNTGYLEIWLQRITLNLDTDTFKETLCKKVENNQTVIWNSEWLDDKLKNLIDTHSITDSNEIDKLDHVINRTEVELFRSIYGES